MGFPEQKAEDQPQFLVALAHNRNDLAETMLHHLARGTGLRGLAGIRPCGDGIIRPVLCLERREIVYYLEENEISYITDSSNLSDGYTRNRILSGSMRLWKLLSGCRENERILRLFM